MPIASVVMWYNKKNMRTDINRRRKRQRLTREKVTLEKISNENKTFKRLIAVLFIFGLLLQIWEVIIYRRTIIDLKIPLTIWLTPGLFLTPILYKKLNDIGGKAHWTLHYILHSCMTGGILLFCFMASNFYFADNNVTERQFKVNKTGYLQRKPYAMINYDGLEKQLVFSPSDKRKVTTAKSATVKSRKGLLGFDILDEYEIN